MLKNIAKEINCVLRKNAKTKRSKMQNFRKVAKYANLNVAK